MGGPPTFDRPEVPELDEDLAHRAKKRRLRAARLERRSGDNEPDEDEVGECDEIDADPEADAAIEEIIADGGLLEDELDADDGDAGPGEPGRRSPFLLSW